VRLVLLTLLAALALPAPAVAGRVRVVAAEDVWGSVAAQLGGAKATTQSILDDPNLDPHAYEPRASDARAFADAQLVIVNGIGYDRWASQLVAANPVSSRVVVDVGDVLGLRAGGNPHQWYSPAGVARVARAITTAFVALDPRDRGYFESQHRVFASRRLAEYHALIARIRSRYHGVAVGYSESVFEPLGRALGLRLATPASFAKAVAEGTEVTAGDRETVARQAARREIVVWIYNSQNATPDVQRVTALARAHRIPVVAVTETLVGASFEAWQVRQLRALARALEAADGRR